MSSQIPPLLPGIPQTHPAIATPAPRAPLTTLTLPTIAPGPGQVLIHVLWTASTPLDLHQADGGLLVSHPAVMGDSYAGVVAQLGPDQPAGSTLKVGDKVFGFVFREEREKAHQTYLTTDWYMVGRVPEGMAMEEVVGVPCGLVTAFNAVVRDLGLRLEWPVEEGEREGREEKVVVVWGAASSVGQYVIQVLRHWGYGNIVAVARGKHHEWLKELGARVCFDYTEENVVEQVERYVGEGGVRYVVDCIGSLEGTLGKIVKLAGRGTTVAIMLPVIVRHADEKQGPVYEMDVEKVLPGQWREGVELKGTRTHFYLQNEFFKNKLQTEVIPALLEQGAVKPNKVRIVEGKTVLERAEKARLLLRNQAVSGEKLVWRIAEE